MDKLAGRKTLKVSGILDEFEKDGIRDKVDLVSLFSTFGVALVKKGKSYMGKCPWHEDGTPSLSVDREKGLYHCFGCGESGDAFTLVQKMKGCDFKASLEYLKHSSPGFSSSPAPGSSSSIPLTVPNESPSSPPKTNEAARSTDRDASLVAPAGKGALDLVASWYARELTTNQAAQAYLEGRGLLAWPILTRLGAGFSVGNLGQALSVEQRRELVEKGLLREDGSEALEGCVTFPLKDDDGVVVGFYGRKIDEKAKVKHLYLKGPHQGLVNGEALDVWREEIILTESVLDAVSLVVLGIERVIPCYGTGGFTQDHLKALKDQAVKRLVIAFDADAAGRKGAEKLTETLLDEGFDVAILEPGAAKDWNEALVKGFTRDEFEASLAESLATSLATAKAALCLENASLERRKARWEYQERQKRWELEKDGVKYQALVNAKRIGASARLSLRVEREGMRFIDHVDLYSSRSRAAFRDQASVALELEGAALEQDLLALLDQLEEEAAKTWEEAEKKPLTAEEEALGRELLEDPELLSRIVSDMEKLGHVGEDVNKLLVYLAASSRKLEDPVSIIIVSESAAGKSYLIDTVRRMMPEEEVVNLTSLSDQALNYMGEGSLMHKLLVLGEAVHNEVVEHQIREMLSAKELSRMVVTKDERTGKLSSALVRQRAVVSLMMSGTSRDMNGENASRCFFVHADESEEQTKRIHEEQNKRYSLTSMKERAEAAPRIIETHQAAQRLLKPLVIVNPFASGKAFPSSLLRARRDNKQLNDLAAAVCFLRQFQKERKTEGGIEYIECDKTDVETAQDLFVRGVMRATYLELPESLVRLYDELRVICRESAEASGVKPEQVSFDQGMLRKRIRWLGGESIKKYVKKLHALEYLAVASGGFRGQRMRYQLVADESLEELSGLSQEATRE